MGKIKVDIDELMERLGEMQEDDYVTVQLEIVGDMYGSELQVSAIGLEEKHPIDYGTIPEVDEEEF